MKKVVKNDSNPNIRLKHTYMICVTKGILVEYGSEDSNRVLFVSIKQGRWDYLGMMIDLFHSREVQ